MKNITITADESLIEAAKQLPEVKRTSLSSFITKLLKRELQSSPEMAADRLLKSIDRASQSATTTWKWNRDEIYEE